MTIAETVGIIIGSLSVFGLIASIWVQTVAIKKATKLDLYDRRYSFYLQLRSLIKETSAGNSPTYGQWHSIKDLIRVQKLLFSKDVQEFLEKVVSEVLRAINLNEDLDPKFKRNLTGEQRKKTIDDESEIRLQLSDQFFNKGEKSICKFDSILKKYFELD